LGTDPAPPGSAVALPPGNRFGEFSIAPGGTGIGSPGGREGGSLDGGTGGSGSGGNDAVGLGSGKSGGGGGGTGGSGIVSMRGGGEAKELLGDPDPGVIQKMVFPLPKLAGPRRSGLVIAAGPVGGGGLGVYGALHCGKIYTILLSTLAKNWTLQYCQTPSPGTGRQPGTRTTTTYVQLEQPLGRLGRETVAEGIKKAIEGRAMGCLWDARDAAESSVKLGPAPRRVDAG
jgi:hypothetical protein